MAQRLPSKSPRTSLSTEQKVAFLLLVFLGVGGIVLGFRSFGTNLSRPFDLQIAENAGNPFLTSSQEEEQAKQAQKEKDTDSDGLNDYDELYVFKTSPYLSDTDSDGFDDYTEVYSNNDPNCPLGADCTSLALDVEAVEDTTTVDSLLGVFSEGDTALQDLSTISVGGETGGETDIDISVGTGEVDLTTEEGVLTYFQSLSLEEVRALLIEAGMSQEQLDQISDELLQELFQEALTQTSSEIVTE
ncbi:MAG: Ig domain-containing protein [Candidatus Uhrbacteria bacterium GW2011_GWE2_40_58]|nr:MAG: Ig domain-containing protein [Candidatus Uhrbacteria bacterium GW2011_GWF2_40_263]KKR67708.1 MAG: Ig domain-containing protein [Candidatus Uhrbacteria bacterium GW2011_GWE2_40_58]OGL94409.1 MAG: hypothetical protein A2239_01030 [Candidatus Uhrbacteria bacterium RIFOXYA2_FULL_40_9]OGL96642.1 MAG: hypothetical protein A2332_02730 [Candidatus Uhrbacteria bacterium RIFOXYB2_FULL_41_18]HBK34792.1 hypothetical protein [Candidatus Uhrbacteria bacterium]